MRKRLPETRMSLTHKFKISDAKFYITVGLYEDGNPGEVFIKSGKSIGSFEHGILDGFSILLSIALQHGVPLKDITRKLRTMRFEPSGITESKHVELRFADSVLDYVAKWMTIKFVEVERGNTEGNTVHSAGAVAGVASGQ
jgi:ribonucleoside-diphosphate reductase alpha chain